MTADNPNMTSVAPLSGTSTKPLGAWRAATWIFHVLAAAMAVMSMVTQAFEVWVDVRPLGWAGMLFQWVWAVSVVLVTELAGPAIRGWGRRQARWVPWGLSQRWARRLLWPTYAMVGWLIGITGYYYWLFAHGRADLILPVPLLAALILSTWAVLTQRWLKRHEAPEAPLPTLPRWKQAGALAGLALTWIFIAGFLLVHCYERPPRTPVDLAVVLGGAIHADGNISVELRNRVLVATDLYKRGMVKHIVLSGGFEPPTKVHPTPRSELTAMHGVCIAEGIPEDAITIDPVGINTKATAFNVRKFMQERGYRSVVACSSDFHLLRIDMSFKREGIAVFTQAAQPTYWRCASSFDTVREMVGIIVYQLFPNYREAKGALMELKLPRVLVRKTAGVLELYDGDKKIKEYACITGRNKGDKVEEGDKKTPLGVFHIVYKNPLSKFHLSLGLDYPRKEDAQRGLTSGLITQAQYQGILEALASDLSLDENQKKLWKTPLGGEIFIHGDGEGRAGTLGCIAVSNADIDELYAILPAGTEVEIRP